MPRAPSPYWKHVTSLEESNRKTRLQAVRCNFCSGKFYASSATRIKDHMDSCEMAPRLDEGVEMESSLRASVANITTPDATQSSFASINRKITDSVDSINESTVQQLDELIGDAIFTGGIPFRFIENPAFNKFIRKIRPSYELPTRYRLCNDILDNMFSNVERKMAEEIQRAKYVSIATDAWTILMISR